MKKISFSLLLCSVFLCTTSCSLEYKPIDPLETHIDVVEDGYYRNSEYSESYENIYLQKPKALDESLTSQMYYKFRYLPSTGNQKILVIPVEFSDYPVSSLKGGERGSLKYIEDAFFGHLPIIINQVMDI